MQANLSWCRCNDRVIFLDARTDRYLALPGGLEPAFTLLTAGEAPAPDDLAALRRLGLAGDDGKLRVCAPPDLPAPSRDLGIGAGCASWPDIAAAIFRELQARRAVGREGLKPLRAFEPVHRPGVAALEERARTLANAHERAGRIIGTRDRCLPRALAMMRACRAGRVPALIVIGVRTEPFLAHCWVQLGEAVLIGDLEHARRFTPIMARA